MIIIIMIIIMCWRESGYVPVAFHACWSDITQWKDDMPTTADCRIARR